MKRYDDIFKKHGTKRRRRVGKKKGSKVITSNTCPEKSKTVVASTNDFGKEDLKITDDAAIAEKSMIFCDSSSANVPIAQDFKESGTQHLSERRNVSKIEAGEISGFESTYFNKEGFFQGSLESGHARLQSNSTIEVHVDDVGIDEGTITVSYAYNGSAYQGILLKLSRERGLPAGVSFPINEENYKTNVIESYDLSCVKPLDTRTLFSKFSRNALNITSPEKTGNIEPKYRKPGVSLRRIIHRPARYATPCARTRSRPFLCAKCEQACKEKLNENANKGISDEKQSEKSSTKVKSETNNAKSLKPFEKTEDDYTYQSYGKIEGLENFWIRPNLNPKSNKQKFCNFNKSHDKVLKTESDENLGNPFKTVTSIKNKKKGFRKKKRGKSQANKVPEKDKIKTTIIRAADDENILEHLVVKSRMENVYNVEKQTISCRSNRRKSSLPLKLSLKSSEDELSPMISKTSFPVEEVNHPKTPVSSDQDIKSVLSGQRRQSTDTQEGKIFRTPEINYSKASHGSQIYDELRESIQSCSSNNQSLHERDISCSNSSKSFESNSNLKSSQGANDLLKKSFTEVQLDKALYVNNSRNGDLDLEQSLRHQIMNQRASLKPLTISGTKFRLRRSYHNNVIVNTDNKLTDLNEAKQTLASPYAQDSSVQEKPPVLKITLDSSGKGMVVRLPSKGSQPSPDEAIPKSSKKNKKRKHIRKNQSCNNDLSSYNPSPSKAMKITFGVNGKSQAITTSLCSETIIPCHVKTSCNDKYSTETEGVLEYSGSDKTDNFSPSDDVGTVGRTRKRKKGKKRKRDKSDRPSKENTNERASSNKFSLKMSSSEDDEDVDFSQSSSLLGITPKSPNFPDEGTTKFKCNMTGINDNKTNGAHKNDGTPGEREGRVCISLKRLDKNAYVSCSKSTFRSNERENHEPVMFQSHMPRVTELDKRLSQSIGCYKDENISYTYRAGDIVWAKLTGDPVTWWPAKILDILSSADDQIRAKVALYNRPGEPQVRFSMLKPFNEFFDDKHSKELMGAYQEAVEYARKEALELYRSSSPNVTRSPDTTITNLDD